MKPIVLKLMSLVIATNLWFIFSQMHYDTITLNVPLCFYEVDQNISIEAPETVRVTLSGKRSDLANLDFNHLAIHKRINFAPHASPVIIQSNDLFLPESIKLVQYMPSPLCVRVKVQDNQLLR